MDQELEQLLERAKAISSSPEVIEESNLRIAVANGMISDGRVTVEALKAVKTVERARNAYRAVA